MLTNSGIRMIDRKRLETLVQPILAATDLELVQVQIVPGPKQRQIRLFVDRPGGVDVATCGRLSRELTRRLDEELGPEVAYRLEVSSPGMKRPIWTLAHYERFAGERVRFELAVPREGRVRYHGQIEGVVGERVRLTSDEGETFELGLSDIAQARVELDPWKGRPNDRS